MKTLRASFGVGLFTLAVLLPGPLQVCRGQILVGGAANQTAAPLASVPATGTFFSATLNVPPWPMDWLPQLPVYVYDASNHIFIVDDRAWDYSASGNAMFAAAAQSGGMGAMELSGPPTPGGTNSGGTNSGGGGASMPMVKYTTNDLWLEIAVTLKGMPSNLVIHTPWYVTNGVYNIFTTTNLAPPIVWQWFTNTAPGQTKITLTNTTEPQRFFALGCTNSSAGTDFWLAFEAMYPDHNSSFQLSLYVSSQTTNSGTVTIPALSFSNNFSLLRGTVTNIAIPNGAIIADWQGVCSNGIHIVADQPVSVYGLYYLAADSAALTAYPTPMLGTNYCILARPSLVTTYNHCFSQFAVLATADTTTLWITPSATAYLVGQDTNTYNVYLNQGCLYQIDGDDATGTSVTSDKPIAVFAGADDADVPYENADAANPLVQEQLPVAAWGNQVLALSFGRPGGDSYRVLSATDNTVVITTTNAVQTNHLAAGQPYDAILDGPVQFQAGNPIQVAQFAQGGWSDNDTGDPCEILLPSTGHYLTSYTVAIPTNDYVSGDFDINFLNVIVPQSAIPTTIMDGAAITNFVALANFEQVGSSDYSAARIPVAPGSTHRISGSQPMELEVYGFGHYDAYSFIGGTTVFP